MTKKTAKKVQIPRALLEAALVTHGDTRVLVEQAGGLEGAEIEIVEAPAAKDAKGDE